MFDMRYMWVLVLKFSFLLTKAFSRKCVFTPPPHYYEAKAEPDKLSDRLTLKHDNKDVGLAVGVSKFHRYIQAIDCE